MLQQMVKWLLQEEELELPIFKQKVQRSSSVVLKSGGASGTVVATFKFGTEGLDIYVPGSGILFEEGVYLDLTATPGVTITFT